MSSQEYKEKHSKRIKNKYLKGDKEKGDFKGAFSIREKEEYKREKFKIKDFNDRDD